MSPRIHDLRFEKLSRPRATGQNPADLRSAASAANVTLDMPRKSWRQAEGLQLRSVKDLDALWERWVTRGFVHKPSRH